MDVRWLVRSSILMREEPEAIRSKTVNGGHADLRETSAGRHHRVDCCTAAYSEIGANPNRGQPLTSEEQQITVADMAPTAETTLTNFLRDPNSIVEKLERQDVVLHRRNAGDLRLSLQSRSEADDEGVRFIAHLLGQAITDDVVGARLVSAAAAIPG